MCKQKLLCDIIFLFLKQTYVVGTLTERVLFEHPKHMLKWMDKKLSQGTVFTSKLNRRKLSMEIIVNTNLHRELSLCCGSSSLLYLMVKLLLDGNSNCNVKSVQLKCFLLQTYFEFYSSSVQNG